MIRFLQQRLVVRLAVLSVLIFCLILILRENGKAGLGTTTNPTPTSHTQTVVITVASQPGTPLVISAARQIPSDAQGPEIAFNVTNVIRRTIRAFAIKQEVEAGSTRVVTVSLINLDLSDTDLQPSHSRTEYSTSDRSSESQQLITLSVDYVQFSDGESWGLDESKSGEKVAGQRAAGDILTDRLIKIMRASSNPEDLLTAIDTEAANIEPTGEHSEEWMQGFRQASNSIAHRLKRAKETGGFSKVDTELNKLATRFKGER